MPDIFISYSRKDAEQAQMLTEMLTSAGLSVWIDKSGIDIATSWSGEIVDAINECKAFVVLLSSNSLESHNVIKEVSLASEKRKKILPLNLEPVALTRDFEYPLAGIQRSPATNIDAIIRALGKLGLEATSAPELKLIKETSDGKKSLMILPFEDLSPAGDNAWFADGIVSELISALSNVKSLKVSDAQSTKEFKTYKGQLGIYAATMQIRYFIQGDVRKFGDNIKISSRLVDIETGEHLWESSLKGTMEDIFEIQEQVAANVLEGLNLVLSEEEKAKLSDWGTEDAEAYELYMKASEYFHRQTKEGFELAAGLLTEAISLDAAYANAYQFKANALASLYRNYDRSPALLVEAKGLCKEAIRIKPDMAAAYYPLSQIYMHCGQLAEAEEAAREYIRKDPQNYQSHFALGFFYDNTGEHSKAIAPFEEAVRLKPDHRSALFNLVINCHVAKETASDGSYAEKCQRYAEQAVPVEARYLKLHPDGESSRMSYAILLFFSGQADAARREAMILKNAKDGFTLYNTACVFVQLGDKPEALATFRKALDAGYRSIRHLKEFLTDKKIAQIRGTPEYEEVARMVEEIERGPG